MQCYSRVRYHLNFAGAGWCLCHSSLHWLFREMLKGGTGFANQYSSVGVGTACGTDMEQIFSIHLFRSEPLNFQGFLPVFDGDGTDGTDVNVLSSYIRKNI